jgi:hypothetical protein
LIYIYTLANCRTSQKTLSQEEYSTIPLNFNRH